MNGNTLKLQYQEGDTFQSTHYKKKKIFISKYDLVS